MNNSFENNSELTPKLDIIDASEADIKDILSIQSQKIIVPEAEKENDMVGENGFLVYPASEDELMDLIENKENNLVRVAKEGDKTAGYIISYDIKEWEKSHANWFSGIDADTEDKMKLENEKTLYGRHIAVDENALDSSIGKKLLDSTLREAANRGYKYFVVEVLKEPITNKRSVSFVEKEGFKLIGQSEDENKRVWFVFSKNLIE